jgi:large conductance mechanosensitive channel
MKSFIDEFKSFAMKGNVIDLAVAVVIGAAFGKIVTALVENIIMPLVGVLLGGISFADLSTEVGDAVITYGAFVQDAMDGDEPEPEAAPAEPPEDIKLLREIRDSLKR